LPIIKSAKKRVKIAAKANLRNAKAKRAMREALKAFNKSLAGGKTAEIAQAQTKAISELDKAVKKNLIHKNKAAREKARLSAKAKEAGVKTPKAAAKAATKKPAPKPAAKKK